MVVSVRRKPARSRPRSHLVTPPVTSTSVAVCPSTVSARSSPVAVSTVVFSCAPFGSLARIRAVATSSSSVVSSPVAVLAVASSSSSVGTSRSVVVSRPASSESLACPVSVVPVSPSPVVVPPVKFGGVSSGPAGSGSTVVSSAPSVPVAVPPVWPRSVPRLVRPRAPLTVGSSTVLPFGRPVCFPFVPVVCFVLAVVPVLLSSPFRFGVVVFAHLALKFWLARLF